jgi:hypothetical protein
MSCKKNVFSHAKAFFSHEKLFLVMQKKNPAMQIIFYTQIIFFFGCVK